MRWRLQLWLAILVIGVLAAMIASGYELARVNRLRQVDADLESRVTVLSLAVREVYRDGPPPGPPGPPPGPPPGAPSGPRVDDFGPGRGGPPPGREFPRRLDLAPETLALFGDAAGYYFVIWFRDGTVLASSSNLPGDVRPPQRSERDTLPHFRSTDEWREVVHCSGIGECALAGRSLSADLTAVRALGLRLMLYGTLVLGVALGVGWWITTAALQPVDDISGAAERISSGSLSERVRVVDPDTELGRLASVLNNTFARLEAAFSRQTQFTADAAHELRTPLAVLISEGQRVLARDRTPDEYRDAIGGMLDTAQQMRQLTETLLALARLDGPDASVPPSPVDLASCALAAFNRFGPHALSRKVTIHTEAELVFALGRRDRIDVVVTNLVSNAIAYNRPGGQVWIRTRREGRDAVIEVSDTGIGIGPADLPHIFERFYRADKSRSRADGHAGLGLAISRTILDAERGRIDVTSVDGQGSTFTVRLNGLS
jgi:signal transduction histidine kinase